MEIKIIKGKQKKKFVTIVYGEPGVGKSTFGSLYPKPVFIGNEVPHHIDVYKAPSVDTYEGLMASAKAIKKMQEEKPQFKTVVMDTLSGIQDGLIAEMLGPNVSKLTTPEGKVNKLSVHTWGGGFAAGQQKILSRFVDIYNILDSVPGIDDIVILSHTRGRIVHTTLEGVLAKRDDSNDTKDEFTKLTPALETKIMEFFFQKADNMFFLDILRTAAKSGEDIVSENKRMVRTVGTQFYMAKNRSGLKDSYVFTGRKCINQIREDILKQLEVVNEKNK